MTSFPMLFHNTGAGLFICTIVLKMINDRSFSINCNICLSGLFLFLMIVLSAYELFVQYNPYIATFGVMLCFSLCHYFLANYFIGLAKPKYKR